MFRGAAPPPLLRRALAGLVAGALVASVVVGLLNDRLMHLLLAQAAARAADQLELGLNGIAAADFDAPYTPERLEELSARLEAVRKQVLRDGSGVIRLNVFARDGTLLYSDLPDNRGRQIDPEDGHLLATALAGTVASQWSSLSGPENADLRDRFTSAFEVYVPVVREGRVVGAYEVYQDPGSAPWLLLVMTWAAVAGSVAAAVWSGFRPRRDVEPVGAPVPPARVPGVLTPRELEVLQLLPTGLSNRGIATTLGVSEETVRSHVKHILRKLEQPDRTTAVVTALRAGLLPLEAGVAAAPAEPRARRTKPGA